MQDCVAAYPHERDNAALARYAEHLYQTLEACNLDKQAIREWNDVPQ